MTVTKEEIKGVFAIMPTPATQGAGNPSAEDSVDYSETQKGVNSLVEDGVSAILTNGTFGEGATLTSDEIYKFTHQVVKCADGRVPVFAGATTLNTRDTIKRAKRLSDLGVTGLLLGRPMWSPCDDDDIVTFYQDVTDAVPELAIIVYDNPEAFKGKISSKVFSRLSLIPQIVAVKYPGLSTSFLADLEAVEGRIRLLPVERDWYYAWRWAPDELQACWSGAASCGPNAIVELANRIQKNDTEGALMISKELAWASSSFFPKGSFQLFSQYNVQLEKIRINEAGYIHAGPSRPPYTHCPEEFVSGARESGRRLASLHQTYAEKRN